uniref:DUF223 domain-containing protein n=1 Tax=Solanum lycopersicum TaxID=4081 RepID=A0A3Q7IWP3_SOLLC
MKNTEVVEDKSHFKTEQFSNGFISFDESEKCTNGNVVCILLTVKALTGEGRSIIREGDFAEIKGQMLQRVESDKPLLAFCDVNHRVIKRLPTCNVINISYSFLKNFRNDNMKAQNIDDMYYKFNATVFDFDSNTNPWYLACNKCYKRVMLSPNLKRKNNQDTIANGIAKGKEFSILVKIDRKFLDVETNMNVIPMEIHEVSKKLPPYQRKVKMLIVKQRSTRMKKLSIPEVEKNIAAVETDIENQQKTNTCKSTNNIKQVIADDNPKKVRIHKVEKQNVLDESDFEDPLIQLQRKRTMKVKGKNIMPYPMEKKIKEEKN